MTNLDADMHLGTDSQTIDPDDQANSEPRVVKRERSAIAFPYEDLFAVLKLARIVHETYGGSCTADQLAAAMRTTTKSGSFRLKVSAGRTFGLLGGTGSAITLTTLGNRALNERDATSRTEAFLNVPLYRALYQAYEGGQMPGDQGLESKIRDLGVATKQIPTARQVFLRSAEQAGFFTHGKDRLVMPARGKVENRSEAPPNSSEEPDREATITKHPLIVGLLGALPEPSKDFPEEERKLWMATLEMNLAFIYSKPSSWAYDRPEPKREPSGTHTGT